MEIPEIRYAEAPDGALIAYQEFGEGPHEIVYIPGGLAHMLAMWDNPKAGPVFDGLARLGRVVLLDRRGFGASDRSVAMPAYEDQVDDVIAVLDAAGFDRPVLWGGQTGGTLCMLAAAMHPERCRSLVLYAATPKVIATDDWPWGVSEAEWDEIIAGVEAGDLDSMLQGTTVESAGAVGWERRAFQTGTGPRGASVTMRVAAAVDVRPLLESVRVPTLVLHTTGSTRHFQVEVGRYLAEHIPAATLVELPWPDTFAADADRLIDEIERFVTGGSPPARADRVLATVLFTDIVGSTAAAAAAGDTEWRSRLDRHDDAASAVVDRYRGRLVKTTGDGILATFDGPARAVHAAGEFGKACLSLGLEIRAGLHVGEVETRGDDVGGIAVHIASRVQGLAGPGEILVTRTVKDLTYGSGIEFEDRGTHELKGVPEPWQVLVVIEPGEDR